jgi:Family of unknown function (DUF6525)
VSNDRGSYRTTLAAVMRAYDELPPIVRRALANAVFAWVPQPFLTDLRRNEATPEEIVEEIAELDRKELARLARRERKRKGRK